MSVVSVGHVNKALSRHVRVSGGPLYAASAYGASVRDGTGKEVSGDHAVVSGGHDNITSKIPSQ